MYKIERVDDEPRTEMIDELGLLAAESSLKNTLHKTNKQHKNKLKTTNKNNELKNRRNNKPNEWNRRNNKT